MSYPTPMDIAEAEDREDNRLESEQTMKLELVKETTAHGNVRWIVELDGIYLSESVRLTEAEALARFEEIRASLRPPAAR